MKLSVVGLVILLIFFYGCEALTPAERGIQRAQQDISKGKFRILYYGKPWSLRASL